MLLTMPEIDTLADAVKKGAGAPIYSNYFRQPLHADAVPVIQTPDTVLFLDPEASLYRAYFVTGNPEGLREALGQVAHAPVVIDYVTPAMPDAVEQAMLSAGYAREALYRRLACTRLPEAAQAAEPEYARPDEAAWLYDALHTTFSPFRDHLPDPAMVAQWIEQRQVLVARDHGVITSYLIYQLTGMRVFMNYWYAAPGSSPADVFRVLFSFYRDMQQRGVRVVTAWVNEENARVIRIHERFGHRPDGLCDYIYVKQG